MRDQKWNPEFEDRESDNVFPGLDWSKVSEEGSKWEWISSRVVGVKTAET
jgi:hypothetical protein